MQKGHRLQFSCLSCKHPVDFSIFDLDENVITCTNCQKKYALKDEDLIRQLKKFEALCRQLVESEEILGSASIGIDIGDQQIKIPYKLLLTRLNSTLELMIGQEPLTIHFRMEPTKDISR